MIILIMIVAAAARLIALDSLPPGILYDTSSNGVSVLNILYNGERPFFINYMGAPEPLILYLQAVSVWIFGATPFALRIVTALASIASVGALYACAHEFVRDRRIALVASFALAVSLELMHFARFGQRATLVPLVEPLLLYFTWRGWRNGSGRDFVAAGVVLGISLYTYLSALMLPIILAILWVHQFFFARARWQGRFKPAFVLVAVSAIIALPRVLFQLMYPSVAFFRASQVSLFQNPEVQKLGLGRVILERLIEYAKMFGVDWQGGSFKQPLFEPLLFVFFLVGVAICLIRWKRLEWFWAPVALTIMFLPDLLGANEPIPNRYRTVGIIAPAFFLVGAGAITLLDVLRPRRSAYRFGSALLVLLLVVSGARAFYTYFVDYPAGRSTNDETAGFYTSGIEVAEAAWIAQQTDPVYLPLNEYARPPTHYLVGARAGRLRSALRPDGSLDPSASASSAWVVLPLDNLRPRTEGLIYVHDPSSYVLIKNATVYVLPPTVQGKPTVEARLAARQPNQVIRDRSGAVVANAYRIDVSNTPFEFSPLQQKPIQMSEGIELMNMELGTSRIQPGEIIPLSLSWRISHTTADNDGIFVHLIDTKEEVVANADVLPVLNAYPTYLWKPGEIVPTHHQIKVPARTQPGKYTVEIGMVNGMNQDRLDVLDAQGKPVDSRVIVGTVKVAPRKPIAYNPSHVQNANFGGQVMLTGYDLQRTDAPGVFRVSLYWQSLAEMPRDEHLFVHVLDGSDKIVAQADHEPQNGNYPTSIWDVGENVRDDFTIVLPGDIPPGNYRVQVGWYDLETGTRLARTDATNPLETDAVILSSPLEVTH